MKKRFAQNRILFLFCLLIVTLFFALTKGSVSLSITDLFLQENRPILYLRVLRIILAVIAGSGLAVSGITLQAILRNPLAEPYLLGTSSGAGVGAVMAIILGIASPYLPVAAFLGALLTAALVYLIARQGNRVAVQSLVLSGVIVSVALSGIIVFFVSFFDNKGLHDILWWLWGSLQIYDFKLLAVVAAVVIAGIFSITLFSQDLNAFSLGEEEAIHLGVPTETMKKILFLIVSLITASLVCVTGIIGFVGLIIPHATRFIVGPNHRILIPASCLSAAIFMVICDLISRALAPPFEIPIGVVTAMIGAPLFIVILKHKEKIR
jgi:iron complex transport system permease protein